MAYTIGQAARMGGVTVRTLHHYEHIGLLLPSDRSGAGYRLYAEADLDRLTRILYYRHLGFALEDIATLLNPLAEVDLGEHLQRQHDLLLERLGHLRAMVAAIEKEMEAQMSGNQLSAEEKLEIFGSDYDPKWEEEARRRWGSTEAWKQSQQRAAGRSKDDWRAIKAENEAWNADAVAAFTSGVAADSQQAMDLAERHRSLIAQHYDCSYAMHRGLADMYLGDSRFTEYFEKQAPGLAQWVHDAIHANADQHPQEQGEPWS